MKRRTISRSRIKSSTTADRRATLERRAVAEALEPRAYLSGIAFSVATRYPAGNFPDAIATGDFNGDGKIDAVVASYGGGAVTFLAGNGNGTFQPGVSYAVGNGPEGIAVGDFNGDGHLDLAVANSGTADFDTGNTDINTISILLGNGDGTFQPKVDLPAPSGPQDVIAADINLDGHLDLISANRGDNSVSEWLGNGDGTFTFDPAGHVTTLLHPAAVAVGDLNRDGKPDLAVAINGSNRVTVMLGNGDGSFQTPVNWVTNLYPRAVAIADMNGDGLLDIVTANFNNTVSLLTGLGNGSFSPTLNAGAGDVPFSLAIGDLNEDGLPDAVITDQRTNTIGVLLKSRTSTLFQTVAQFPTRGGGPVAVAVADLNGDGRPDVLATNFNFGTMSVLLNTLQSTTTTLVSAHNPAPAGASLQFTAVVRPADPLATVKPFGYVQFFDNGVFIGAVVTRSDATSALLTNRLTAGIHVITAIYLGNNFFGGSSAAAVTQIITAPVTGQALLTPTFNALQLPAGGLKPTGAAASARIIIQNQGDTFAGGTLQLRLFLSDDPILSGDDTPVTASLGDLRLNLSGLAAVAVVDHFTIPAGVLPGTYFLLAELVPVSGFAANAVSEDASAWVTTVTVI